MSKTTVATNDQNIGVVAGMLIAALLAVTLLTIIALVIAAL